jgi:hypothetical protein
MSSSSSSSVPAPSRFQCCSNGKCQSYYDRHQDRCTRCGTPNPLPASVRAAIRPVTGGKAPFRRPRPLSPPRRSSYSGQVAFRTGTPIFPMGDHEAESDDTTVEEKSSSSSGSSSSESSDDEDKDEEDEKAAAAIVPPVHTVSSTTASLSYSIDDVLIPQSVQQLIPVFAAEPSLDGMEQELCVFPADGNFPSGHLVFNHGYMEQHIPMSNGYNVDVDISAVFAIQFVHGELEEYRVADFCIPRAKWLFPQGPTATRSRMWPFGHPSAKCIFDLVIGSRAMHEALVPQLKAKNGKEQENAVCQLEVTDSGSVAQMVQHALLLAHTIKEGEKEEKKNLFNWWIHNEENVKPAYITLCVALFAMAWQDAGTNELQFLCNHGTNHGEMFKAVMDCFYYHQVITAVASRGKKQSPCDRDHFCIDGAFCQSAASVSYEIIRAWGEVLQTPMPSQVQKWFVKHFRFPSCICEWDEEGNGSSSSSNNELKRRLNVQFPHWLSKWIPFPGEVSRDPAPLLTSDWQEQLQELPTAVTKKHQPKSTSTADASKRNASTSFSYLRQRMLKCEKDPDTHACGTAGKLTLDFFAHVIHVKWDHLIPSCYHTYRGHNIWTDGQFMDPVRTSEEQLPSLKKKSKEFDYTSVVNGEWNWSKNEYLMKKKKKQQLTKKEEIKKAMKKKSISPPRPPPPIVDSDADEEEEEEEVMMQSSITPTPAPPPAIAIAPATVTVPQLDTSYLSPSISFSLPSLPTNSCLFPPSTFQFSTPPPPPPPQQQQPLPPQQRQQQYDYYDWAPMTAALQCPPSTSVYSNSIATTTTDSSSVSSCSTSIYSSPVRPDGGHTRMYSEMMSTEDQCVQYVSIGDFDGAASLLRFQLVGLTPQRLRDILRLVNPHLMEPRKRMCDELERIAKRFRAVSEKRILSFIENVHFEADAASAQVRAVQAQSFQQQAERFVHEVQEMIKDKEQQQQGQQVPQQNQPAV